MWLSVGQIHVVFVFYLWVSREVLPSSTLLLRMSISCKIAGGSIDDLKTKRRIKGLGFLFY
jgi:hypothetical protein